MNKTSNLPDAAIPSWVSLRSHRDIRSLDRAARLAWEAVRSGTAAACPGRSTAQVGKIIRDVILRGGGQPAFEGYCLAEQETPFPGSACISVNEEAAHTPPGNRVLSAGDLVTIDVGVRLDGWYGDVAESFIVTGREETGMLETSSPASHLLRTSRRVLAAAVGACAPGVRWSSVARVVRATATAEGLMVLPVLAGHGVGRMLHEPPRAGYRTRPDDPDDFLLLPGMVLTIEPIVVGLPGVVERGPDGWSVRMADGSWACHIERMLVISRRGAHIQGLPDACFCANECL